MIFSTSKFPFLDEVMQKVQVNRHDLSKKTGIRYNTLGNKLRGSSDFTCSEMFKVKDALESKLGQKLFLEQLFTIGS